MNYRVSIITPVYNALPFIRDSILSAVKQKEVIEVIVIDDGSTDGSYELLSELKSLYSKLNVYTHNNRKNKGPGPSRNLGIKYAKGDLITFLDADDYFLDNRFATAISKFKNQPELEAFYEPAILDDSLYPDLNHYGNRIPEHGDKKYISFNQNDAKYKPIERWILDGGLYPIHGLTVKRKTLLSIGLFDENLIQTQDTDLHYRLALNSNVQYSIDPTHAKSVRRIHKTNFTQNQNIKLKSRNHFYEKHLYLLELDYSLAMKLRLLKNYLFTRENKSSRSRIRRYFTYFKTLIKLFSSKPNYLLSILKARF